MTATELVSARFIGLETWSTRDIVETMVEGQISAVSTVASATKEIANAVDQTVPRLEAGGRLIYIGAGTSGRLGAIDAAELAPTFGWPQDRAIAVMAGGAAAFSTSVEGAEDDGAAAIEALRALNVGSNDVVIGLAASGRTPFVMDGLTFSNEAHSLTIGISNAPDGPVRQVADHFLVADTGAEIIAGSTRMKAGTAQKAILTCLSSAVFVRMGYVYRGRMVDMSPSNDKLKQRAIEIVADLADASNQDAGAALLAANWSIKQAIVMLQCQLSPDEAQKRLASVGDKLHRVFYSDAPNK